MSLQGVLGGWGDGIVSKEMSTSGKYGNMGMDRPLRTIITQIPWKKPVHSTGFPETVKCRKVKYCDICVMEWFYDKSQSSYIFFSTDDCW